MFFNIQAVVARVEFVLQVANYFTKINQVGTDWCEEFVHGISCHYNSGQKVMGIAPNLRVIRRGEVQSAKPAVFLLPSRGHLDFKVYRFIRCQHNQVRVSAGACLSYC